MVHCTIKAVEIFITKILVVDYIPLSASIVERISVPFAGEVKPLQDRNSDIAPCEDIGFNLGMSKFITFEVQVAFASKRLRQQAYVCPQLAWTTKGKSTYRIILCNAIPRAIIGVMGVRSDI